MTFRRSRGVPTLEMIFGKDLSYQEAARPSHGDTPSQPVGPVVLDGSDGAVFSELCDVAVLVMGEDEGGAGGVTDLARAGGDVLEGAPAAGEQGEPAFAQAAQGPLEGVAGAGVDRVPAFPQ